MKWRVQRLDATASTNDDVRRAAEIGESEGLVITAERQSAGRGRHGRVWESPSGNLYCSLLLQPSDIAQAGLYSFVVALAVYEAVQIFLPAAMLTLKWPNDILVGGKKISGILLEVAGDKLIAGIGLNAASFPDNALYPATSLAAEGAQPDLHLLLDHLLDRAAYWHELLQKSGFEPVRAAWLERAQKGAMTVKRSEGVLRGDFAGLDPNGALRLRLADGTERVIATGDVFFRAGD